MIVIYYIELYYIIALIITSNINISAAIVTFPHTISSLKFLGHLMKMSSATPLSKAG